MIFEEKIDVLRHNIYTEFFVGCYVKTKLPDNFNPSLDIDNRPLMVITSFVGNEAFLIFDSISDSNNVTINGSEDLEDLEFIDDHKKSKPIYVKFNDAFWYCLGRTHSLLRAIKVTDTMANLEVQLLSDYLVTPLTKEDVVLLNSDFSSIGLPINISSIPLENIEITSELSTVEQGNSIEAYAKLNPLNSTESNIEWSITSSDQSAATLTVDPNDSRIVTIEFNELGSVSITAKSLDSPTLTHTKIFTVIESTVVIPTIIPITSITIDQGSNINVEQTDTTTISCQVLPLNTTEDDTVVFSEVSGNSSGMTISQTSDNKIVNLTYTQNISQFIVRCALVSDTRIFSDITININPSN